MAGVPSGKPQRGWKAAAADVGGFHAALPGQSPVCHSGDAAEYALCEASPEPASSRMDQEHRYFKGGEDARETKYEFSWPLGDVVTTLAQAGMRIERLQEYPSQAQWRFGEMLDTVRELPGEYLLVACKEMG